MAAAAIAARTYARMVYSSCAPIPFRCSDGNGNKIHLFLDCERSGTRAGPSLLPAKGTPPMGYAGPGMVPARSSSQAIARPTRRVDRRRLPLCRVRPRPVAGISARGDHSRQLSDQPAHICERSESRWRGRDWPNEKLGEHSSTTAALPKGFSPRRRVRQEARSSAQTLRW
jgi:hypothetical protein